MMIGDQVLRLVAGQLCKVGGGGKVYRYGGEEFTLLFPGKSVEQSLPQIEAVRLAIEQYRMQLRDRVMTVKASCAGPARPPARCR